MELLQVRAHAAFVAGTEANRDEARAVYVRAIAQHPESAQIHTDFALHLIRVWYGAVDLSGVDGTIVRDAEGLLRTAMQLDPALPAPVLFPVSLSPSRQSQVSPFAPLSSARVV